MLVHTHPPRMVKLSSSFVPRTTWCTPSYSKPTCRPPTGRMPCTVPLTSSTSYQPKPCASRHYTLPSLALCPCTITCVFGFACYPSISATASHKLVPRSVLCVLLRYSTHHKGYLCLDRSSNRIIISRHVTFDESSFPFATLITPPALSSWMIILML
jgi:hypothetical protein